MQGEIHVGDVGTKYRVKCIDEGVNFDPSSAQSKKLIFKLPTGDVVERDATVEGTGPWYLAYVITSADATSFHGQTGKIQIQGRVIYGNGDQFSSNIIKQDSDGDDIKVNKNLD
jgi:hypothetical protein